MTGPGSESPTPREVPAYTTRVPAPRRTRYVVAVFVLNENGRLHSQLERMRPVSGAADVVVADGGSTDGSVEPDAIGRYEVRGVLVKTGPGRLGAQMRMAFDWALREGYEGVIAMDGNDKDDPAAIPDFVAALEDGADHVQGSRFIEGGQAIRTPLDRLLAVRLIHAPLISLAARFRYTDTTNGFRGYSRRFLEDTRVAPFRDVFSGYEFHYYLAVRAARLGFDVREIPVTRAYPASGKTPTRISPVRGRIAVLRSLWRACRGAYDPPPSTADPTVSAGALTGGERG
ncbi:MAG: glycosyltransferase family 2 protein [Gemmatimonadota bacterium]|nr:glycosyltransferase family 2 protein [Gemmatimonadota bacterium]